ncbi:MAG: 1-phosphofructokinase family hexose kinase [Acidobacteriota bacterium]
MGSSEKYTLIVSLNAAIDRIISVARLDVGQVQRSDHTLNQAGGKGINVARALTALGQRVFVIGFAGGHTGEQIREDLHNSGIPYTLIPIMGHSRNCYIVVDQSTCSQTVINEAGPQISAVEYEQFRQELMARLDGAQLLICSGSLPPGIDAGCYGCYVRLAHTRGLKTLVDASGEALKLALEAGPYMAKPNREEAEQLLGIKISDGNAVTAARHLRERGAGLGLVSLDGSGAAATWDGGEVFVRAPNVSAINAVACGDAFLAGCAAALLNDEPPSAMIEWGVAAGSANALVGGARITRAEVERLRAEIARSQGGNNEP